MNKEKYSVLFDNLLFLILVNMAKYSLRIGIKEIKLRLTLSELINHNDYKADKQNYRNCPFHVSTRPRNALHLRLCQQRVRDHSRGFALGLLP
jgi:hypothetical protein